MISGITKTEFKTPGIKEDYIYYKVSKHSKKANFVNQNWLISYLLFHKI